MRIFAISDPHGNYSSIGALLGKAGSVDAVLIAGDITNFGPVEKASELVGMFNSKVLAVPGNCDPLPILETLDSLGVNLHNRSEVFNGITFVGFGGSNPTPFCTPFEIEECDIESKLEVLMHDAPAIKQPVVLLSHAPPYGVLDTVGDMHVGCRPLAKYLGSISLIVCGHIHEARGIRDQDGTIIVNPGMAASGFAALIDIETPVDPGKRPKIDVRLINA